MNKVVILHGTEGSPEGNWFEWLKDELESHGYQVWLPSLPRPMQPSLNEWTKYVINECPFSIDEDTTLIGHSSGAITVLVVAQRLKTRVKKVISVGVFKDNSLKWDANNRLFDVKFDFAKMKQNCTNYLFIHSDDDPYCPLDHPKFFAKKLDAKLEILPGQGHFNLEKSSSYKEFPRLLEFID